MSRQSKFPCRAARRAAREREEQPPRSQGHPKTSALSCPLGLARVCTAAPLPPTEGRFRLSRPAFSATDPAAPLPLSHCPRHSRQGLDLLLADSVLPGSPSLPHAFKTHKREVWLTKSTKSSH